MIRNVGYRILAIRKYHGFKRPIVASDFDRQLLLSELLKKNIINAKEFEKKGDKAGRNLYYPKYGASIWDEAIQTQYKKDNGRSTDNSRFDDDDDEYSSFIGREDK